METDQQAERAPAQSAAPRVALSADHTPDVFSRHCGSRLVTEHVATKWGALALVALADSSYRFSALRRKVDGVSERMLSQTLQTLERDGFVTREVLTAIPPRVEYALTPLGAQVAERLRALVEVLEGSVPQVVQAQQRYDAAH